MKFRGFRARVLVVGLLVPTVGVIAGASHTAAAPPSIGDRLVGERPDGDDPDGGLKVVEDEYLVQLEPRVGVESAAQIDTDASLHERVETVMAELAEGRIDAQGADGPADTVLAELNVIDGFGVRLSPDSARRMAQLPGVAGVYPNRVVHGLETQFEPEWGLDRIDQEALPLDETYTAPNDGSGVHIYVIDGGILESHEEFKRGLGDGADFAPEAESNECYGHGTHVAGTAGGATVGVAKQATLHSVRAIDCSGSGSLLWVFQAMEWVAENAELPAVVNMSLGGPGVLQLQSDAVDYLAASGVTTVAAAGNDYYDACVFGPASAPRAITVGATDKNDVIAKFSNFGPCVDVFAPGVDVRSASTLSPTSYIDADGTSMSTPHVAGAVAIYLHDHPDATPAQVHEAIVSGAAADEIVVPADSPNRLLNVQALPDPGSGGPTFDGPVAHIMTVYPFVEYGTTTVFDGSKSIDPDGTPLKYEWTIDTEPEILSTEPIYEHRHLKSGSHNINLKVTNAAGKSGTTSFPMEVNGGAANLPPVADFTPGEDQYVMVGASLNFDGSASNDPDGGALKYEWYSTGLAGVVSDTSVYSRTFDTPGRFEVELVVTDEAGEISKKAIAVFVADPKPPVAVFTPGVDQYVTPGTSLSFDGSGSNDPDGGALRYEWRSTGMAGVVSDTSSYSRTFDTAGRVGVELTVIDDEGAVAKKHINVWVAGAKPPLAVFTPGVDQYVTPGTSLSFDGSGSNDPDGGALRYEWRSTGLAGVVSDTSSYSRTFDTAGRVGVELTVIDDEGAVAKKHINVWVAGAKPPVATFTPGAEQRVSVGQTLTFDGSQSNDPDGGALKYAWRSTGLPGVVSGTKSYSRKFTKPGRFGVELTVIDDEGQVAKKHINVWVS